MSESQRTFIDYVKDIMVEIENIEGFTQGMTSNAYGIKIRLPRRSGQAKSKFPAKVILRKSVTD